MLPRNETAAPAGAEHTTLYVAIEISRKSWVVGIKSPVNDRIGLHTLEAANVDALLDLIERHRATLSANITETPATFGISVGQWR